MPRKSHRNNKAELSPLAFTVISDPDTEYGFSPGVIMNVFDHHQMLIGGCYTPGTILRNGENRYFIVKGYSGMKQKLQEIECPNGLTLTKPK